MRTLGSELRQAWRALLVQPWSSLLIVAVLTLGLASVIAMLTIIKGLVWNPLPFPNAAQVVQIGWQEIDDRSGEIAELSRGEFVRLKEQLGDSATLAGAAPATINVADATSVVRYDGAFVSHNLFSMLGVAPVLGRDFRPEDDAPGAARTLVLSHAVWRDRFGGADVLGKIVRVNGESATIIGVMPPEFEFPRREQVWSNLRPQADSEDLYGPVFARAAPDRTRSEMLSAAERWLAAEQQRAPDDFRNADAAIEPLANLYANAATRQILWVMLLTVVLVLLVACANAANVALARSLARSRDLSVRLALGAGRWRLALHLFAQSLWMNAIALALALPLSDFALAQFFSGFQGTDDGPPAWLRIGIDAELVLFAFGVMLVSALIVAAIPVMRLRTDALGAGLRDGGRAVAGGSSARIARWLVAAELALACVVLMTTVVAVRGVDALNRAELGVGTDHLLTARIGLFANDYPDDAAVTRFFETLVQRLEREPGVVSASATTTLPGQMAMIEDAIPAGFDVGDDGAPRIRYGAVDAGFFATFRVRLRAGRGIEERDNASSEPVIVIDQRFADRYFQGRDPLGQQVQWDVYGEPESRTVIGVVDTLVLDDVNDDFDGVALPSALLPFAQLPQPFVSVAIRTQGDPGAFKQRFTEVLREHDPNTPAYWLRTYEEVLRVALAGERVISRIFTAFGLVALLLAAAGLYGLIAELVAQRTREIGVQRALGASNGKVLQALLRNTLPQVGLGLLVGIALAVPVAGVLQQVLVVPPDARAYLVLIATLGSVAMLAILLPARRALSVDPTVALRSE